MSFKIKQAAKHLGIFYNYGQRTFYAFLNLKKHLRQYHHRERLCHFGEENPEKTFYVIGVRHTTAGLFAIVKSVFCHICYAVEKGYIPVVDMQHFRSQLCDATTRENAWEAFFEQPCGYSLKDIAKSKNIIMSSSLPFPKGVEIGFGSSIDQKLYNRYHELFVKYIRPCQSVKTYLEKKHTSVTSGREKILGVLCRGTDYTEGRPSGHPIQPTVSQTFTKIQQLMEKYGYENVFLATEDQKIFDALKSKLGEKLIFSGQKLFAGMNGKKFLSEIPVSDYSEKWHNIVDYYASIYILAKCDALSAGVTCGSICAYLISDHYQQVHFWDLGLYP